MAKAINSVQTLKIKNLLATRGLTKGKPYANVVRRACLALVRKGSTPETAVATIMRGGDWRAILKESRTVARKERLEQRKKKSDHGKELAAKQERLRRRYHYGANTKRYFNSWGAIETVPPRCPLAYVMAQVAELKKARIAKEKTEREEAARLLAEKKEARRERQSAINDRRAREMPAVVAKYIPASQIPAFKRWILRFQSQDIAPVEFALSFLEKRTPRTVEEMEKPTPVAVAIAETVAPVKEVAAAPVVAPAAAAPRANVKATGSARQVTTTQRDPAEQLEFKRRVWANFGGRCAICGDASDVNEGAHLEPWEANHDNSTDNGVLLSPTFHRMLDRGLMAIHPQSLTIHFKEEGVFKSLFEGQKIGAHSVPLNSDHLAKIWIKFTR